MSLCQGCVCLPAEKRLHIPQEMTCRGIAIEQDINVCVPCYNRIRKAIDDDVDLLVCPVGNRILGIQTKASAYDEYAYNS